MNAKLLKTARTLYLYADGHAVVIHEKRDADAGRVDWVTLHQSIGVNVHFHEGRLIVSDAAAMALVLAAAAVNARAASTENGSQNTKARGIAVGSVSFNFGRGWTIFSNFPGLIGADFTYQPEHREAWADIAEAHRWADYTVGARYPTEAKAAA